MNDTRKQQIQDIVAIYTNRFTCAVMGDYNLDTENRMCAEANNWMLAQKTANGITNEELREALKAEEEKARQNKTACVYSMELLQ